MAISPILASAILNQKAPNIVGSFRQGFESARAGREKSLAGKALGGDSAAFSELRDLNPEVALKLGEQIRAQNASDIEGFIRDSKVLNAHLGTGDIETAKGFLDSRLAQLQSRGADTTQTMQMRQLLESGNANEAYARTQKFLDLLSGAKQANEGFTLSQGQKRYDAQGNVIAEVAPEQKPPSETPEDKQRNEILKEVRADIRQQLKGVNTAASEISTNLAKVQNLAQQIDKGNRSAVPAAVVALVKLGDPGSVVSQAEIETALNKQNPVAALASMLTEKGVDSNVVASLEQKLDPLDPLNIKTAELLSTAQALVAANVPAILQNYESAREQSGQLTEQGVNSLFTSSLQNRIESLKGLMPQETPAQPGASQGSLPQNQRSRLEELRRLQGG